MKKFKYTLTQNQLKPLFYTISFESNNETEIQPIYVIQGSALSQALPTVIKNGYIFDGWYLDEEFLQPANIQNTIITSDITLYAKLVADIIYVTIENTLNRYSKTNMSVVNLISENSTSKIQKIAVDSEFIYSITYDSSLNNYILRKRKKDDLSLIATLNLGTGAHTNILVDENYIFTTLAGNVQRYNKSNLTAAGGKSIGGTLLTLELDDLYFYAADSSKRIVRYRKDNFQSPLLDQIPDQSPALSSYSTIRTIKIDNSIIYVGGNTSIITSLNKDTMSVISSSSDSYPESMNSFSVTENYLYAAGTSGGTGNGIVEYIKSNLSRENRNFSPLLIRNGLKVLTDENNIYVIYGGTIAKQEIRRYSRSNLSENSAIAVADKNIIDMLIDE
jgi:uncharacterized repeat protein (TIGR02543 family)